MRGSIDFKTPFHEKDEVVFVPGLDLGRFQLNEDLLGNGSKYSFSILGPASCDLDQMRIALSCALGAPAWLICRHSGDSLSVILSNFKNIAKARPIIHRGEEYISWDISRENFAKVFNAAISYQATNSTLKNRSFHNAVLILLEGRSLNTGNELRAMAAFHFLEWIDNTNRMSAIALAALLKTSREEADAVIKIRNSFIHNRESLRSSTKKHFEPLLTRKDLTISTYARYNPTTDFSNFLHSVCADLLMREIKYTGTTEPYFSLRHGE